MEVPVKVLGSFERKRILRDIVHSKSCGNGDGSRSEKNKSEKRLDGLHGLLSSCDARVAEATRRLPIEPCRVLPRRVAKPSEV